MISAELRERGQGKKRRRTRTGGEDRRGRAGVKATKRGSHQNKKKMEKGQKRGWWRGKRRRNRDNETQEAQSADDSAENH